MKPDQCDSAKFESDIQRKLDSKTKPLGALGDLESVAKQLCIIQNTLSPEIVNPQLVVFAGDHGIALDGVSAYPQEVTWQMVMNFVGGGAAINVFTRQHDITLSVVDAGVNYDFPADCGVINQKIAKGTKSFLSEKAMSGAELDAALVAGEQLVAQLSANGCNTIGFGEMGIGNTSSATAIISQITDIPLEDMTGRGTGLNDAQLDRKLSLLNQAFEFHGKQPDAKAVLQTFGGFEVAQMVGAMLSAASREMIILVDGFIASAAFLVAHEMDASIRDNAIFCHQSDEGGHQKLLQHLQVSPLLNLHLRLGEGTGCALAFPIIESAIAFMNEMASFEDAGVSSE